MFWGLLRLRFCWLNLGLCGVLLFLVLLEGNIGDSDKEIRRTMYDLYIHHI